MRKCDLPLSLCHERVYKPHGVSPTVIMGLVVPDQPLLLQLLQHLPNSKESLATSAQPLAGDDCDSMICQMDYTGAKPL